MIRQLGQKKFREKTGLFIAEGEKIVSEALQNNQVKVKKLFFTESPSPHLLRIDSEVKFFEITPKEMKTVSRLETPSTLLAIIQKPLSIFDDSVFNETILAFDFIQDPGNLGTIIRTADWFGIHHIVCSKNSVDAFNQKVVQASMGAIFRTQVFSVDLQEFLTKAQLLETPIFGTFLSGENIYSIPKPLHGIFLFGNESKGISPMLETLVNRKITIPNFSKNDSKTESLNVASSVAVVCSEIIKR
ncbi:MAG: RNA methyltransferase [Bacteroidales bacterium]|nr:RNA methyltransferase [Bacteroidales bacterium]